MTSSRFPLRLAATALAAVMLAQCDRNEPIEAVPAEPVADAPAPAPVIQPNPVMSRADLISAVARAASAYAAGEDGEPAETLSGRRFSIRMPFGCYGPQPMAADAPGDGLARWVWGEDRRSIRLTMTPGDWADSALVIGSGGGEAWEAVEGFWVPRAWLASEDCPGLRPDPLAAALGQTSPNTVGLAAVFDDTSSRTARRDGRAYVHTIRPEGDDILIPSPEGYRVVLEGRIGAFPDGRAIHCRAAGPDQRPVCVAAVSLERVAFESADRTQLSEWRS